MDDYGIADTNDPAVRILWEQHDRTVVVIPVVAAECGYAWFHETAFGRDLITCNRAAGHEGKHERAGD